jgi:Protein phosphatase 2C
VQVRYVSVPAPGGPNLDLVVAAGDALVVLDGATPSTGVQTGCSHGVAWYVRRLGLRTAAGLLAGGSSLEDVLAEGIRQVCADHRDCDLTNPYSPSATVAILRSTPDGVDHVVLGDCAVVLSTVDGAMQVVRDDRLDRLLPLDSAGRARLRNREGGFWVAGTAPDAARMALTGRVPAGRLDRAVLLTDGGYRLVADYGHGWADLLAIVARHGPAGLVERTRRAERAWAPPDPGRKRYDDATVVECRPVAARITGACIGRPS